MAEAFRYQPRIAGSWVRTLERFVLDRVTLGLFLLLVTRFSSASVIPAMRHSHLYLTCFYCQNDKRAKPGNPPKQCSFGNQGALDMKIL